MNKASLEGIGAARHASPLFDAASGVETGCAAVGGAEVLAGAVAGGLAAGVVAGGFGAALVVGDCGAVLVAGGFGSALEAGEVDDVIAAAGIVEELLEELAPQPLSAETRKRSVS